MAGRANQFSEAQVQQQAAVDKAFTDHPRDCCEQWLVAQFDAGFRLPATPTVGSAFRQCRPDSLASLWLPRTPLAGLVGSGR
jgi:hypothetical protein